MSELLDKIIEAKGILGDKQAEIIAEGYPLQDWCPEKGSAKSIFNKNDNTPSMMWMKKDYYFKDFSTGKVFGILDYYMYKYNEPYMKAVKRLLDETGVSYNPSLISSSSSNEQKEKFKNYRFPREDPPIHGKALEYMAKRHISADTCRYIGLGSDARDNVSIPYKDIYGKTVVVKYRPSHAIKHGMPKYFYQKDADVCPILFNIDKVDISRPLLLVEGPMDAMACIEAGYTNVASIPSGAADDNWIGFNYEFLDQFQDIILWFDNDEAGEIGVKKAIPRLGEYRIKIVKPIEEDEEAVCKYYKQANDKLDIRKTDANNILVACGPARVLALINSAEEIPMESIVDLMQAEEFDIEKTEYIPTGVSSLDKQIYGFVEGTLNIWTAYAGCVDCDTEFFDGYEWKRIADYQEGDKVLQYNDDGTAELVMPLAYHKLKCESMWHFKTKYGLDQCLSDEHNVYYLNDSGNLVSKTFREIREIHERNKSGFGGKFLRTFKFSGNGIDLSDAEIKLMCAVICDGSFNKTDSNLCRFHLKKDRKKNKLREILAECGINHKEHESCTDGYTDFYIYAPGKEKEFTPYWYQCTNEQLQVVCDNILFWDGSVDSSGRRRFSTTVKSTADFVQFAFTACGHSVSITECNRVGQKYQTAGCEYTRKSVEYSVFISDRKTSRMLNCNGNKIKIEPYRTLDGFKYCFTVPSHKWIMRRNNRIVVSGNCGKALTLDSDILSENGYIKMKDVKVGTKVYSDDGKLYDVTGVYPQGKKSVLRLKFDDDSYVDCSSDHLWTFRTSKEKDKVITATCADMISTYGLKDENGHSNIMIDTCSPIQFPEKDLYMTPYEFGKGIVKNGITCIPDEYKFNSVENRIALIQGIIDGYGQVYQVGYEILTVREKLAKDIAFIANTLGARCEVSKDSKTPVYIVHIKNGKKFKLHTKKSFDEYKTNTLSDYRRVVSCEPLGDIECQCIMVNSPSHLFLTNSCIPTHNTTMLSQVAVLEAIDKGESVFWFNAESTTDQMLNWILSQAAGRQHCVEYTGANGFKFYKPTPQATDAIKRYYLNKIYVYDNLLLSNPNMVYDKMKYMYKKRGTRVFVIDNWLCLNFRGISDTEVTGIQVDFMNKLIHFTKQNNLEIHLVCHPRKAQAGVPLSEYEILGTSNIVNMADRIYGLEKTWDNDLKALGYDRQFTVFKDRVLGTHGERIGLKYDRVTRRLYGQGDDKYRRYSWDDGSIKYSSPYFGKNGILVGDRVLDYEREHEDNIPY